MNWAKTIEVKSDQLNGDDLISGPITIKITAIKMHNDPQQPASVCYEGDNGKPYKPCKSMRRVMALKWGTDEQAFVGKSMTLERDPTVKWAGEEVGGIRITHMSDMKDDDRFMLTYSRGVKKAYKVEHLVVKSDADVKAEKAKAWVAKAKKEISACGNLQDLHAWRAKNEKTIGLLEKYEELMSDLDKVYKDAQQSLESGDAE